MKKLFACAMKTSVLFAAGAGGTAFLLAPVIAQVYSSDPEVITLAVFSIRCMAAGLVLDTAAVTYQNYLQGIQRLKLVNFLCFTDREHVWKGAVYYPFTQMIRWARGESLVCEVTCGRYDVPGYAIDDMNQYGGFTGVQSVQAAVLKPQSWNVLRFIR